MITAEKDRAYLEAGIPELGDYLLSHELYWPIAARGYDLPRLTIGGILLAKTRLEARAERIEALVAHLNAVRSKWQVAWETKAGREVQARMRLWSNYLADYRHNPEGHADAYPHEVRSRVMLHLLLAELAAPPAEQEGLSQLDAVLRTSLSSSGFIWETDLQPGFPREVYWFLYGNLT
ncbi:MAG: hypothetical protein JW963_26240 [Anaerolineales bacterium]|nr:hypothetical protein [Anaerolineales bacterium]